MAANLIIALKITLIGMGLVFLSIILLWLTMAVLMMLNKEKKTPENLVKIDEGTTKNQLRRKAAVAAVVVALAREAESELHEFPLPPTAFVSAWQAVNRSDMLKKRGRVR